MPCNSWFVDADGVPQAIDGEVGLPLPRPYRLYRFLTEVDDLLADDADASPRERAIALAARMRQLLRDSPWLHEEIEPAPADPGYALEALYDEPGFTRVVQLVSWRAGGGRVPHDHGDLAVLIVLAGVERHSFWRRGPAGLEQIATLELRPGDLVAMAPETIHAVEVLADVVTLNLYGSAPLASSPEEA